MNSHKISLEELSRFIDNELSDSQRLEVTKKLSTCSTSDQLLSRLRELTEQVSTNILTSVPASNNEETEDCLTEDDIIEIVEHKASPATLYQAETHIASCRRCLALVMQNIRTAVSMNANNWSPLPETIATDSRVAVISKIKRPDHCIERTGEQIGEIRFNLRGNKQEIRQEFGKGRYGVELILKRVDPEVASLEITFTYNKNPKSQVEIILSVTPDSKQVFRGLTGLNGKSLIRRIQPEDYLLSFKGLDAVISLIITSV